MEAEVMFEYEPTQADELALKVGTIIKNVKEVDDGWCEGEVNGVRGLFPDNFVQLRPASSPAHPPPASEPPSASIPLRNIDASKKIRRAKVTFSYAADGMDELTLEPGQIVELLEEEEEGWWKGRIGGSQGVFPSNFVEEILEEAQPVHQQQQPPPPAQQHPPPAHHPTAHHPPAHQQPVHQPSPEAVDFQTGERSAPATGETEGLKPGGVRGPKVMPTFDPTKARANLKKASVAPPLEKPPEHKKVIPPSQNLPPKHPEKLVERAKVTFDYEADDKDELTIKVGDVVDIVSKDEDQEGWWEVMLNGHKGLVPDNFVELLPPPQPVTQPPPPSQAAPPPKQAPAKPPLPKEPTHPPPFASKTTKKPEPKKFPAAPTKPEPVEDQTDFPVPKTTPLDTSAMKDRPKNKNRPPSRSNLLANHEPETPASEESSPVAELASAESKILSPWQAELKAKKHQPKPKAPKPAGKPKIPPAAVPKANLPSPKQPRSRLGSKDVEVSKPDPPPVARSRVNTGGKSEMPPAPFKAKPSAVPTPKPALVKPIQQKPVETKPPPPHDTPAQSEPPSVPSSTTTAAATLAATTVSPKAAPVVAAAATTPLVVDNSWKEAYEKLKEDFQMFKDQMIKEIQILTDDLDKERKHRAGMDIDIDRLKKAQRSLGH